MAEASGSKPPISPSLGFQMVVSGIKKSFPAVKNISTSDLEELMAKQKEAEKKGLVIVDARPEVEYNVSHIPSAVRLDPKAQDMAAVTRAVQEQAAGDSGTDPVNVVMYCSVGYRSSGLAERFRKTLDAEKKDTEESGGKETGASSDTPLPNINVFNLEGSIFKWANENREMEDCRGSNTKFVHPYSSIWGQLVSKDIRKWEGPNT